MPASNKPLAYMAADVIAQASVLRKNDSDYPQCSLLETATNASAKTLSNKPKKRKNRIFAD